MAQVLVGYDVSGSIQEFDVDGDLLAGGAKNKRNLLCKLCVC